MYEDYYGLTEKPFSLTPDPKYLYRSQSHADAFELLQYAIQRREGFAVITGDIGTGKTTLCRALLEQIDRTTFTALVLNPFISEEDLLKRILLDFGVISRDELKAGRLASVTKQEMVDALYDFLLGLIPLKASAVLIIDEAQNLPLHVLEQIRILSNLETDKEKLLQIILVGQLNLRAMLRSTQMRQLDQRVSIRYELKPLDEETVAAYVAHRLTIAGGSAAVAFTGESADAGAPAVGRHPSPYQSDLRSRPARRFLGRNRSHHAADDHQGGVEPEPAAAADRALRVQLPRFACRRRGRGASGIGIVGWCRRVALQPLRRGDAAGQFHHAARAGARGHVRIRHARRSRSPCASAAAIARDGEVYDSCRFVHGVARERGGNSLPHQLARIVGACRGTTRRSISERTGSGTASSWGRTLI